MLDAERALLCMLGGAKTGTPRATMARVVEQDHRVRAGWQHMFAAVAGVALLTATGAKSFASSAATTPLYSPGNVVTVQVSVNPLTYSVIMGAQPVMAASALGLQFKGSLHQTSKKRTLVRRETGKE